MLCLVFVVSLVSCANIGTTQTTATTATTVTTDPIIYSTGVDCEKIEIHDALFTNEQINNDNFDELFNDFIEHLTSIYDSGRGSDVHINILIYTDRDMEGDISEDELKVIGADEMRRYKNPKLCTWQLGTDNSNIKNINPDAIKILSGNKKVTSIIIEGVWGADDD